MSIRVLKKALGLLLVDVIVIIGIFVLQFRTDSSIIHKIGNLQFTFVKADDSPHSQNVTDIKNKLNVSYNGLNFFCDDENSAFITKNDSTSKKVQLTSWESPDDLSCKLNFTENVSIVFELANKEANSSLAIVCELPKDVKDFTIPYHFSSNMKLQKDDGNRMIMAGRKNMWEVSADSLSLNKFTLSTHDYVATYGIYDTTQKFTFDSVVDLEIASANVYKNTVESFKTNLINAFKNNNSDSTLTEQIVVSYIATQSENNNYTQAIEDIPSSYKKNANRTYLSAPYLNNLEDMNATLEKAIRENEKKITDAANNNALDIFTLKNIANFMYLHSNSEVVTKLFQSTEFVEQEDISIAQATGILNVFTDMSNLNSEYAKLLVPVVEKCIERITLACSFEGNILTISDNDTFLSVIQAVETGAALLRYGKISHNQTLEKAGYVLVNSYMAESSSFDLRTLANLYSILSFENPYYPHFEKIIDNANQRIWAWTCAKDITWQNNSDGTSDLNFDFEEGLTHYVIIKGLPQFSTIYIYNMAFRTDPRFETYNSSGYVYKKDSQTLLLKSRHKSNPEVISFEYAASKKKTDETETLSSENSSNNATTNITSSSTSESSVVGGNVTENENSSGNGINSGTETVSTENTINVNTENVTSPNYY